MPIDSNNLQGSANHPLSIEEVDSLLSTFSKERKPLICLSCNQQGHFRRHGSIKSDPPHLLFRCVSCGKCFQAASMKHIIYDSCQEQSQIQAPTDMEQTRSLQENNNTHTPTTHSSQNNLQTLLDTIQRLTQELQQARAEINSLRSQTDKLQQQLLQQTQTAQNDSATKARNLDKFLLCKTRKNRNLKPSFSTIEGPGHAADVMASHLQTIYSGRLLQDVEEDHLSFYNSSPFSQETCPVLLNDVKDALRQLLSKKTQDPDHIRQKMLVPLQPTLAPILLFLFQLCWTWSYTPAEWRLAKVVSIYKKGDPTEPGNHRPISLTSFFRKLLERSIHHFLIDHSPPLDIAQGGFRESRGSLDQALCLAEHTTLWIAVKYGVL
ncbi:hypothetical protein G6F43_013039 [Rhizopus delemar]|nr:hypothetical protein G6F43_013039 [Rhizopus delemar]